AILGPFMPQDGASKEDPKPKKKSPADAPTPEDFVLSPELRELLQPADIQARVNMKHILFDDLEIKNFVINTDFSDLRAQLNPLSLDIFNGTIKMIGDLNLDPMPIAFAGSVEMQGVETQKIIELVTPEHKDLLEGRANFSLAVDGQGTTVP